VDNLRSIIIGAAARYSALSLRVPNVGSSSWVWAGDLNRYVPSMAAEHLNALKRILKSHRRLLRTK
ncbi:Uncharacterized protein FKW44_010637, partial [Caligus rogercresseyi]